MSQGPEKTHEVDVIWYAVLLCHGDRPNLVFATATIGSGASAVTGGKSSTKQRDAGDDGSGGHRGGDGGCGYEGGGGGDGGCGGEGGGGGGGVVPPSRGDNDHVSSSEYSEMNWSPAKDSSGAYPDASTNELTSGDGHS